MRRLEIEIAELETGTWFLAPAGMSGPQDSLINTKVVGGRIKAVALEAGLGLAALWVEATDGTLTLTYEIIPASEGQGYPEAVYTPRITAHTVAADDLAQASHEIADAVGGGVAGIRALVAEAEARFTYDHPVVRFNDGTDAVPYLACGKTPGSCVDINTYLVASLRAAGYEAGYVYGYFFPAEKGGVTHDMHCWVVTRHAGEVLDWDIAHHMKAGLGPTQPGLNPRPGWRVALGHSMGHIYVLSETMARLKLLAEPMRQRPDGTWQKLPITARLPAP
ncbi:Transglutaminase-like superfamily protein [Roseovarius azorensis]|uniref:Transglutaminase-like superfamily protein n=1 Tax=Roseovarius azorensis TaxID=1287727 RepID=A0A1H7Q7Y7_9RHOB|nr:transglutaminase-like domain-containing protein [Roseovarius azorensis]SEL43976.1 Transglutaminase-like superfamily protein [Roseovarius azorensis]